LFLLGKSPYLLRYILFSMCLITWDRNTFRAQESVWFPHNRVWYGKWSTPGPKQEPGWPKAIKFIHPRNTYRTLRRRKSWKSCSPNPATSISIGVLNIMMTNARPSCALPSHVEAGNIYIFKKQKSTYRSFNIFEYFIYSFLKLRSWTKGKIGIKRFKKMYKMQYDLWKWSQN
jgi:hypothetical protein